MSGCPGDSPKKSDELSEASATAAAAPFVKMAANWQHDPYVLREPLVFPLLGKGVL
jgi:hypothetical protein